MKFSGFVLRVLSLYCHCSMHWVTQLISLLILFHRAMELRSGIRYGSASYEDASLTMYQSADGLYEDISKQIPEPDTVPTIADCSAWDNTPRDDSFSFTSSCHVFMGKGNSSRITRFVRQSSIHAVSGKISKKKQRRRRRKDEKIASLPKVRLNMFIDRNTYCNLNYLSNPSYI